MFATIRTAVTFIVFSLATPALADEVVLTVSGAVEAPAEGSAWEFDMVDLKSLPAERFETTTIWTEGPQQFEGVPLVVLLDHVGATGSTIRAVALNDYAVSIPVADAVEGGPIVAYGRNGDEMSVRDKGPLWIVYPFDDNEIYKSEEYYSRSIWQLDRIELVTEN
ncbi:molybdopterin-dependent oxidoreductase [Tateyamaria sp. ANG-S1]|uniref:molybdopterin-dependent oxidoreductase n=1 Tax=Tateyamaria sp. ANG-S1 TaxID=1577905 RepID=UPI00057E421C|nr:molybdopterin-dependent oxidoreductase [Tateyamaria sp. ANG-S1]KIC48142.1 oxidoreductase [Tateyamaria sp. ANG-S1]